MSLIHNYNFKWYHYRDNFLSHDECDTIIKKIDNAEQIWSNSKLEKIIINAALDQTNGKKNEAAILLGLGRNTLAKKIKELGI